MEKKIRWTKDLKLALIGMLLGDANLQSFSEGKTARLRILHSIKQIDYLHHKYMLFQPLIRTRSSVYKERQNGKVYEKCYFNSVTTKQLKFFYDLFYRDGKKIVPKHIHRYLEPITLAYWYMDDGSLTWKNRSKAIRLCTDGFSGTEVKLLVDVLNKKYLLKAIIHRQRSRFRIYIPNKNNDFIELIRPYILESMTYKIPSNCS